MKIFVTTFVLLSIVFGLNAHCVRHQNSDKCSERIFPEPEPKEIHYIYHGETCDCPKFHDVLVEQPVVVDTKHEPTNYEYGVQVPPPQEEVKRYLFDVRVEKPVIAEQYKPSSPCSYQVQVPPQAQDPTRYIFDSRVEQPIKPCEEKPWQGLVAQVDRILQPARGCVNSEHTAETCNCGCNDPSHTPGSCTCGTANYQLPVFYNSRYDNQNDDTQNSFVFTFPDSMRLPTSEYGSVSQKMKREAISPDVMRSKSSRRRNVKEIKFPKLKPLKKLSKKSFQIVEPAKVFKQKLPATAKSSKPKFFERQNIERQSRPKRKPDSPCGYTYESCDPKKHNRDGCPLCYKCKCEPVMRSRQNNEGFSPHNIRVPYKLVTHEEAPGSAPMNQEFNYEPSSYTGLKEQDMYKKYINQIVSKYPEHMSRKMPDVAEQERDLVKFIGELSKSDKSPGAKIDNEDARYKVMDNAMEMYKYYEKAVNLIPKTAAEMKDGKFFKKRGTVLEVIELNPEDYHDSFKTDSSDDFSGNVSESQ